MPWNFLSKKVVNEALNCFPSWYRFCPRVGFFSGGESSSCRGAESPAQEGEEAAEEEKDEEDEEEREAAEMTTFLYSKQTLR